MNDTNYAKLVGKAQDAEGVKNTETRKVVAVIKDSKLICAHLTGAKLKKQAAQKESEDPKDTTAKVCPAGGKRK